MKNIKKLVLVLLTLTSLTFKCGVDRYYATTQLVDGQRYFVIRSEAGEPRNDIVTELMLFEKESGILVWRSGPVLDELAVDRIPYGYLSKFSCAYEEEDNRGEETLCQAASLEKGKKYLLKVDLQGSGSHTFIEDLEFIHGGSPTENPKAYGFSPGFPE